MPNDPNMTMSIPYLRVGRRACTKIGQFHEKNKLSSKERGLRAEYDGENGLLKYFMGHSGMVQKWETLKKICTKENAKKNMGHMTRNRHSTGSDR